MCVRPTDPLMFALEAETRAKSGSSQGLALTCKWAQDEVHLLCAWSPCQCLTTLSPLYSTEGHRGNRHSSYHLRTHVKNLLPEIAVHRYTVVREGKARPRLIHRQIVFESYSSLKGSHCLEENSEMSLWLLHSQVQVPYSETKSVKARGRANKFTWLSRLSV